MTQPSLLDIPESRSKKRGSVRRSSVLTYQAEQGWIGKRAYSVKRWLARWAVDMSAMDATSAELSMWSQRLTKNGHADANDMTWLLYVRRGLSDCQTAGVVERVPHGDRKCRVSGRTCATWRLKERG